MIVQSVKPFIECLLALGAEIPLAACLELFRVYRC